jgi:GNAT superfamily N-acetyltransferase
LGGNAILIEYRSGNHLDLDTVIGVYRACSLGARRPVDDRERMRDMLANADITITAWDGPLMVGISRSISDFRYATYLSDLAVRESHQRLGIGKELIRRTQAEAPDARIILLSAPAAVDYYPRIGMTRHDSCWMLAPGETIP